MIICETLTLCYSGCMISDAKPVLTWPLWVYVVLWIFYVYLFVNLLSFKADEPNNLLLSGLYFIEFGVHEVSHILTMAFPPIITAAAGSVGEISFTILIAAVAFKSKAYFAAIFASIWVALAFSSVGRYIADARVQELPLVGPGETVKHDWNFILSELGMLQSDIILGTTVRWIGIVIGAGALAFGLWLIIRHVTAAVSLADFRD